MDATNSASALAVKVAGELVTERDTERALGGRQGGGGMVRWESGRLHIPIPYTSVLRRRLENDLIVKHDIETLRPESYDKVRLI